MSFPLSPVSFPELFPRPDKPRELAEGVSELSRFRIARAFVHIITVTAAYTISAEEDRIVLVDASGGAVTVTLPAAANADAAFYGVKAIDVTGGNVTVDGDGAETIDGAANVVLNVQYQSVFVISDGTQWWII
jgi:hypothetical protein